MLREIRNYICWFDSREKKTRQILRHENANLPRGKGDKRRSVFGVSLSPTVRRGKNLIHSIYKLGKKPLSDGWMIFWQWESYREKSSKRLKKNTERSARWGISRPLSDFSHASNSESECQLCTFKRAEESNQKNGFGLKSSFMKGVKTEGTQLYC